MTTQPSNQQERYLVRDAAKLLGMKESELFAWLEKNHYVKVDHDQLNLGRNGKPKKRRAPAKYWCEQGVLARKVGEFIAGPLGAKPSITTLITSHGVIHIAKQIEKDEQRTLATEQQRRSPTGPLVRTDNRETQARATPRSPATSPAADPAVSCHTTKNN